MDDAQFEAARHHAPKDVKAVVDRWEDCAHWGGEEPYDKERGREIDRALKALRCDGLPRDVAFLRHRYAGKASVQRLIEAAHMWFDSAG